MSLKRIPHEDYRIQNLGEGGEGGVSLEIVIFYKMWKGAIEE